MNKQNKVLTESVKVSVETGKILRQMKLDKDLNSIDDVIKDLLGVSE